MESATDAVLSALGLTREQRLQFERGMPVVTLLETEIPGRPGVAILHWAHGQLRCGVVEVNDPGGGLKTLLRFRARCVKLARALGQIEYELFGAEVINPELSELLVRHGFRPRIDVCPDDLGGGTMAVLFRVFSAV